MTLPASHECTVVEFIGMSGHWRCACGRAYRLVFGKGHVRAPELDDRPLPIEGDERLR